MLSLSASAARYDGHVARLVGYGEGRALLISATIDVVAEKGLRGMTFRAVAEHAHVNNSLVAHHFGNRAALLAAALESAVEQSIESTHLLDLSSEEQFADALLTSITERPELQAFQYEMILEARRNELFRDPVTRLYDRYHAAAEDALRAIGFSDDTDPVARWLFAALDGIVLQSMAGVPETQLRAAIHNMWTLLRQRATGR
jgi:AcrR family transcriptional regulator